MCLLDLRSVRTHVMSNVLLLQSHVVWCGVFSQLAAQCHQLLERDLQAAVQNGRHIK